MNTDFFSLPLEQNLLKNLKTLGYQTMTAIQAKSLPLVLEGKDIIAQAKTGSGKTAAFGLGILSKISTKDISTQALVLCPTRELADQVAKELRRLARATSNLKILTLCGGTPSGPQRASLEFGAHIVIGTPGRIEDLLSCHALSLKKIKTLVLDEADRMLDMGFSEVIFEIIRKTPPTRQTLLFSATFPKEILEMSAAIQKKPEIVKVESLHDSGQIKQIFYETGRIKKTDALIKILTHHHKDSTLIFCATKEGCRDIASELKRVKFNALAIHGDLEQRDREKVLVHFSNKSCPVLVATDVAARGLDIKSLSLVINYDISRDPEVHIHRIGRTGRAGESGLAVSIVQDNESRKVAAIEDYQKQKVALTKIDSLPDIAKNISPASMITLLIDSGKKNKLRPGDILGALTGSAEIPGEKVGMIHIFDFHSYVAIEHSVAQKALSQLSRGKIKGKNIKVRFS